MIKFLLAFLGLVIAPFLHAQHYYPLHPSVGDTIELIEKLDYALFPKAKNPDLTYCLIDYHQDDGEFKLLVKYQNQSEFLVLPLSKDELIEAQKNIEKINQFYKQQAIRDSIAATENKFPNKPSGKAPVIMSGPMLERAKKQARMYQRLEEDRRDREMDSRKVDPQVLPNFNR
jgi:hypothetical protein